MLADSDWSNKIMNTLSVHDIMNVNVLEEKHVSKSLCSKDLWNTNVNMFNNLQKNRGVPYY